MADPPPGLGGLPGGSMLAKLSYCAWDGAFMSRNLSPLAPSACVLRSLAWCLGYMADPPPGLGGLPGGSMLAKLSYCAWDGAFMSRNLSPLAPSACVLRSLATRSLPASASARSESSARGGRSSPPASSSLPSSTLAESDSAPSSAACSMSSGRSAASLAASAFSMSLVAFSSACAFSSSKRFSACAWSLTAVAFISTSCSRSLASCFRVLMACFTSLALRSLAANLAAARTTSSFSFSSMESAAARSC
mmetsp:Transcript_46669/g.123864  ORF Transcript_46669/g.123864 Transcript_46669/m.123864 type:complete len:249 (+) Transcript_46669:998-1744(+)